ncbi:MAG: thiol-disulfide oxidoreductase DCC family protein [Burkholderiales bacterium]
MNAVYPLTLLYDAACPVCSLEMDHLRQRDTAGRLVFVNINEPGFDPRRYGATLAEMNAVIHGVQPDGSLLHGVEVLRLAYAAVGLGWVMRPTGWPLLRPAFDLGYRLFARHRMRISAVLGPVIIAVRNQRAKRRMREMQECKDHCAAPTSNRPETPHQ